MKLQDTKFSVSTVTLKVARVGMQQTVVVRNHHIFPGNHPNKRSSIDVFSALFLIVHGPDSDPSPWGFYGACAILKFCLGYIFQNRIFQLDHLFAICYLSLIISRSVFREKQAMSEIHKNFKEKRRLK